MTRPLERFRGNEISVARIASGLFRRVLDIPHGISWHFSLQAKENKARLAKLHNIHTGERCVIIANGPSLANMDLSPLANETTFGMNRIYVNFRKMGFMTTYYLALNELVIEQYSSDIGQLRTAKFINWNRRGYFAGKNSPPFFLRTRLNLRDDFQADITFPISSGGTVTFAALQVAFFMGFHQVIIVGLDHRFSAQGTPNAVVERTGADTNHFDPNYFPEGSRWQLPDLRRSELAYEKARKAYAAEGRQILDATTGGACRVFSKVNYQEFFGK